MAKSDKQPFAVGFVNDRWEAGVANLTWEAEYVYFRLCKAMWATGQGVLKEDAPAVCRFHPKLKVALQALLRAEKLREVDGRYVNDRALDEHARAVEQQGKNREKGKRGAEARWGKPSPSDGPANAQASTQASAQALPGHSPSISPSNSHPDPYPLEKNPINPASGSAGAKPEGVDTAVRLIAVFDQAQQAVYAEKRRHFPAATDLSTAQRFLAAGLTEADAGAVFAAVLKRTHASGKAAPRSLSYVEQPVADHLAAKAKPMPEGRSAGQAEGDGPLKPEDVLSEADMARYRKLKGEA